MSVNPFDSFRVEKQAGEYKDFGDVGDYPLKGVTYPVAYGDIEGYVGEDGANLDIFMGNQGKVCGYIKVFRPELADGEHKFYLNVTDEEEQAILEQFAPVIMKGHRFETEDELYAAIEPFRVPE
jgi:hypothetical protein